MLIVNIDDKPIKPRFLCDVCMEPIDNIDEANLIGLTEDTLGLMGWTVHWKCDQQIQQIMIAAGGVGSPWTPLADIVDIFSVPLKRRNVVDKHVSSRMRRIRAALAEARK